MWSSLFLPPSPVFPPTEAISLRCIYSLSCSIDEERGIGDPRLSGSAVYCRRSKDGDVGFVLERVLEVGVTGGRESGDDLPGSIQVKVGSCIKRAVTPR